MTTASDDPVAAEMKALGGHALTRLIDAWFADHFHGNPALRDTAAYNAVVTAVADLKQRILIEENS